ncbi:unnamed protein product [Gongylonema pulchrum]|uniref:Uncharacterized protein n=1 Tax=Gongylonema pulchrum TaxID=637853 RepID=A0A183EGT7_9BILA|nr:unnamed protein product [Gongylonema pulchrum]
MDENKVNSAIYAFIIVCQCLSMIAHFFKRHRKRQPAREYSIPEATRHSNLPYNGEPSVQTFSRL